jgi:hypothetical protein
MNFYFISTFTVEEDEETKFISVQGQPIRSENIGIMFHCWPFDDIFSTGQDVFCTERLKCELETEDNFLSGIGGYEAVRSVPTANWLANYPASQPDLCWQIRIDGRAMQDDFGFYPIKMLVCSERAVKFLLNNHCTNIRGLKIQGDAKEFFDLYASHLKETNFNYRLPKVSTSAQLV